MTTIRNDISRLRMHEHDGSLQALLGVIEDKLTASSLMTPWPQVDSVTAEAHNADTRALAKAIMDKHQYTGVPLVWSGQVRGVYVRNDPQSGPRFEGIKPDHFVQPELGLVQLIRRMRETQKIVVGVGAADAPVGWLTYADFSKRPFRVLLFAIVAEVEYLLAQALDVAHPDDSWLALLPDSEPGSRDHRAELVKRRDEATHWDVTMPLTTFAEIGHLIHAAAASPRTLELLGESQSLAAQLKSLPELRNRVAHVVRPVVAGPKQIAAVASQIDLMLGWIDNWSARLSSAAQETGPQ